MAQYTFGLTRLLGHGHAFSQVIRPATPAVASGFTYTNDGSYWEMVDLIAFRLVTDGSAANRQVTLTIKDGGGVALATLPAASVQTASLTWDYTWSTNFDTFGTVVALAVTAPLPEILLQPTFSITVAIGTVQTGDQVSNIRLYAQRFVTGSEGYLLGVLEEDDPRLESYYRRAQILA